LGYRLLIFGGAGMQNSQDSRRMLNKIKLTLVRVGLQSSKAGTNKFLGSDLACHAIQE